MGILSTISREFKDKQSYEVIEYVNNMPFRIKNITKEDVLDGLGNTKNVLEHWHDDIEIVYTISGNAKHYIDGQVYVAEPNSLFITNSQSIHKVLSDVDVCDKNDKIAIVLNINNDFVKTLIPNMYSMYFLAYPSINIKSVGRIMHKLSKYIEGKYMLESYEELYLTGLVYELMYFLCKDGLRLKEEVLPIKYQKNLQRLRGIMEYVTEHYRESIKQKEIAEKFYFTKEYFSRFFKKNTGMTFKSYLTRYRVNAARQELIDTNKTILEISLNNGFSDIRGLINAFKNIYRVTPLHYRKNVKAFNESK